MRNGELHLGAFSDIKLSNEVLQEVQTHRVLVAGKLRDARVGMDMKVRATVVQIFEPRFLIPNRTRMLNARCSMQ